MYHSAQPSLQSLLEKSNLKRFQSALEQELNVTNIEHLTNLADNSLSVIGMNSTEIDRLRIVAKKSIKKLFNCNNHEDNNNSISNNISNNNNNININNNNNNNNSKNNNFISKSSKNDSGSGKSVLLKSFLSYSSSGSSNSYSSRSNNRSCGCSNGSSVGSGGNDDDVIGVGVHDNEGGRRGGDSDGLKDRAWMNKVKKLNQQCSLAYRTS
ncbi:hypothetical protein HELRODRAFT_180522 [Helobdella robusta]|uniref:non-specific protein-tyrosine kinase n=1 Tax=Helobdella robusta TaxID=6412 RepID=T1FG04_HELRO|nr:hypothetical protein HELRODRAFT_180522 [Helobdella robusta]ESN93870.1 hypothetical protein HELRODRAFT_180522 [Helobdella robusta]